MSTGSSYFNALEFDERSEPIHSFSNNIKAVSVVCIDFQLRPPSGLLLQLKDVCTSYGLHFERSYFLTPSKDGKQIRPYGEQHLDYWQRCHYLTTDVP